MQSLLTTLFARLTLVQCLLYIANSQPTNGGWNPRENALIQQNSILLDMKLQELRRENQQAQQSLMNEIKQLANATKSELSGIKQLANATKSELSGIKQLANATKSGQQQFDKIVSRLLNIAEIQSGILVQQHYNGTSFFNRTWNEFKVGFGDVTGNYWIGNDRLHELTKFGQYKKLRVEMKVKYNSQWYWAEYKTFRVENESNGYKLTIGGYTGTAGDSMAIHNGMKFTTNDRDYDQLGGNCAVHHRGGFWYNACYNAGVNTPYTVGDHGFSWYHLPIGSTPSWTNHQLLITRMTLRLID